MFRITRKKFTTPAISKNGNHYFVDAYRIEDGYLKIAYCTYIRHRRKFIEDTMKTDDKVFIKELFIFAVSKKLLPSMPDDVQNLIRD